MAHGELQKGTWILEAASGHVKKQILVVNSVVKPEKGVVPVLILCCSNVVFPMSPFVSGKTSEAGERDA